MADPRRFQEGGRAGLSDSLEAARAQMVEWGYVPADFEPQGETERERWDSLRARATCGFYAANPQWQGENAPRRDRPIFLDRGASNLPDGGLARKVGADVGSEDLRKAGLIE